MARARDNTTHALSGLLFNEINSSQHFTFPEYYYTIHPFIIDKDTSKNILNKRLRKIL